jgi:hypothetical protein
MAAADRSGGWVTTVMGCARSIQARGRGGLSGETGWSLDLGHQLSTTRDAEREVPPPEISPPLPPLCVRAEGSREHAVDGEEG